MHIKDDFSAGAPISQVPASWFNKVAKFINSLIGGEHVTLEKHDDGNASVIVINDIATVCPTDDSTHHPKDVLTIPSGETASQKQAREIADIGTSDFAARADHQHRLNPSCVDSIANTFGISITPDYSRSTQIYLDMPAWAPPAKMTGDDTNHTPCGWERGKTAWKNGHIVDDSHPAVGCSIKVCSHVILRTVEGTQRLELFFTNLQFDENGMLVRAIPGCDWFTSPYT